MSYLGTPVYLAPELADLPGARAIRSSPNFDAYQSADVYSLGLVFWEIIKNGQQYVDKKTLLSRGQNLHDYLDTLCALECDALLDSATSSCDRLLETQEAPVINSALKETLVMCLKDDPLQRGCMANIVPVLADGTR